MPPCDVFFIRDDTHVSKTCTYDEIPMFRTCFESMACMYDDTHVFKAYMLHAYMNHDDTPPMFQKNDES